MEVICKYKISARTEEIEINRYAKILSCVVQRNDICLYALINTELPKIKRNIYCIGTGHELKNGWLEKVDFINTVNLFEDNIMWHIFIEKERTYYEYNK